MSQVAISAVHHALHIPSTCLPLPPIWSGIAYHHVATGAARHACWGAAAASKATAQSLVCVFGASANAV